MKINRIRIENFRSIQETEFNTTNFNIFVGQNNCGKTNFFEALEFFFNGLGMGGEVLTNYDINGIVKTKFWLKLNLLVH